MPKLSLIISLICLLSNNCTVLKAQTITEEFQFAQYLIDRKMYQEAIWLLSEIQEIDSLSNQKKDSLYFLLGEVHYQQKNLDSAIIWYEKVNDKSSSYYLKTKLFEAFLNANLGEKTKADSVLNLIDTVQVSKDEIIQENILFQKMSMALLQRELDKYQKLHSTPYSPHFSTQKQRESLEKFYTDIQNFKPKSAFLAGFFSTILPGSGKIYAGKLGQGISSLLQCTALGLQTWEAYRKKPTFENNPRLWIYGGLFSVFYIGNIWGSSLSVHVRQQEFNDTIDDQILFNMHIPLRTVFR
jgi:tetratricopeptide (TPR) repeat protein